MEFEFLSRNAEQVLLEIIEYNSNGKNTGKYWFNKFQKFDMAERYIYCSIFDELSERKMIEASWADDGPYYVQLLNNGISYFDNKKAFLKEQKRLSHREWKIAIISGLIGAIVGLVPDIIELIRGYLNAG